MTLMADLTENKPELERDSISYPNPLSGRYIVFSDIQGHIDNLNRFLKVTENMKREGYICLGDIVHKKRDYLDSRCVQAVKDVTPYCVAGNHEDVEVEGSFLGKVLQSDLEFLDSLPGSIEFPNVLLFHSSLRQPGLRLRDENDICRELSHITENFPSVRFALYGHTHNKGVYSVKNGRLSFTDKSTRLDDDKLNLINPGAIGLRYSLENGFAVVDFGNHNVHFFSLEEAEEMSSIADVVNGFDNRFMSSLNVGYNQWFDVYAKNDAPKLRERNPKFSNLADILEEFDPKSGNDKDYIKRYSLGLATAVEALNPIVAPFFITKSPLESREEFLSVFERMA